MGNINRRKFLQDAGLSMAGVSLMGMGNRNLFHIKQANGRFNTGSFFAYYPGLRKLEVSISALPLEPPGGPHVVTAVVRYPEEGEIVRSSFTVGAEGGRCLISLPEMKDGLYELTLDFGNAGDRVVRSFLHKNFKWLGNDLGKSKTVHLPFEPVRTGNMDVQVVGRTYRMNGFGLWNSVISEGVELLAAPVMLRLLTEKGEATWKFSDGKWVSEENSAAVYQTQAVTPALEVETSSTIEYDGCMKVELSLMPGKAPETIKGLWLEIPLKNSEAPLFHYVTVPDIRRNYAGATPHGGKITWMNEPADTDPPKWPQGAQPPLWKAEAGSDDGTIWSCRDIRPWEHLYKTDFVPYIWLGGGSRGIAWFGDNPAGYLLDAKGIVQRIERRQGSLTLRVDLINKPSILTGPRKIIFGLQASPTRPMPKDWRSDIALPSLPVGDMVCWGGHECADKYPDDENFDVVEEIIKIRQTGSMNPYIFEKLDNARSRHFKVMGTHNETATWLDWVFDAAKINQAFFQEGRHAADGVIRGAVMAPYRYHVDGGDPHGPRDRQTNPIWENTSGEALYPDSVAAKVNDAPLCIYFEEHASNIANVEWAVYQDEWRGRRVYASRSKVSEMPEVENNFNVGRQGSPESYRDFALWYANEWMKRGVSIYIDNMFPEVVDNPLTSAAFVDDEGDIQPSATLWDLREYHKRIWTLEQEWNLKKPPYKIMITHHMTNAFILPVHTWNDITLDLEWWAQGAGENNKNDIIPFSPELLLAESAGRQTGSYRHVLRSVLSVPAERWFKNPDPQIVRMEWGMRMVHEAMRWLFPYENYAAFEPARSLEKALWQFGYGTEDCRVINYWDNDPPIRIKDPEVKWLLLVGKDDRRLLLVMQSYRREDVTVDIAVNTARLGFNPATRAQDVEKTADIPAVKHPDAISLSLLLKGPYDTRVVMIG